MTAIHKLTGISVSVQRSIFAGGTFLFSLTDKLESYSHDIEADYGYAKASIAFNASQVDAEEWLEAGLARDIKVYDESGQIIWNGIVNSIAVSMGGIAYTIGPVLEVSNRTSVVYSAMDTSTTPPTPGLRKVTAAANDTASQALYGILVQAYSASGVTDTDATQLRDLLLSDYKMPATSQSIDLSGNTAGAAVSLSCVGYAAYLDRFTYSNAGTGTQNLSVKLLAVLAADPNALFTDTSKVTANTTAVPVYQDADSPAFGIIKGLVSLGDAALNRYTFGVYGLRVPVYAAIPTSFEYAYSLSAQTLKTYIGGEVLPWNVLPSKWVFVSDFLSGRLPPTAALRNDPRSMFIETVSYTAPFGLVLNGSRNSKVSQKIARLGLGGM